MHQLNFTLRPYQLDIYNEIPRRLKTGGVLVQAPARSGKSKIIAALAARIVAAGKIPVVLTHRGKIQRQLIDHVNGVSIDASTSHVQIAPQHAYVAMNQTLVKRPWIISQLQALGASCVLIIDEAHRGDFCKLFELLPAALRVGFSATPAWKWAKFMPDWYASLIHGPQPAALIQGGNITPITYYEMRTDLSTLQKASTGDYTEQSQFDTFDKAQLYDGLFEHLSRFTFNKAIAFAASKKSADKLNQQMLDNGYKSVVYYSGLKNGTYELAKFTELNEANVLVTVSALSEGFDHPPIDFNILWRATTSLPLFIQMAMRGATPCAGKDNTTILDFGGNNSRFGGATNVNALVMDRDWNALWQPPEKIPKRADGVSAVQTCPACDYMLSAMAKSCSNCGFIFPAAHVALKQGELVEIQHSVEAAEKQAAALTGRRISTLTANELAIYAKQNNKKAFAMRIAKSRGITDSTYLVDYGAAIGYKPSWADRELRNVAEILQHEPDYKLEFSDIIVR
jgi:superfamily II DNA or RNA helicase